MKTTTIYSLSSMLILFLIISGCSKKNENPVEPSIDTEKPVVTIILPVQNQEVKGSDLIVEVNATDNVRVVKVELFIDTLKNAVGTIAQAPWKNKISIDSLNYGRHTIIVKASDAAGNVGTASVQFKKINPDWMMILFKNGSRLVYDRWEVDENNHKIETSKRSYTSELKTSGGIMRGSYNDWFYDISLDSQTNKSDTLYLRTDETNNVMSYGFITTFLTTFIESISSIVQIDMPVLPSPTWDYISKFNGVNDQTLPISTTWDIIPASGVTLDLTIPGFPIPISATINMKGKLEARGELFIVNGKQIRATKTSITVSATVLGSTNDIKIFLWYSDDPSGQIKLIQEGQSVTIYGITVPVLGDYRELVSFQ